ncbi:MAG: hypothetical protein E6772_17210 [Dysgonomonas sp.]|nr:hypothetical protein [Dysgonomonas sp.]
MASNSNYDPAKKTTKLVRGIHSWIKFQKHQGVESLTIQGKEALADISQDKNGDTSLILNADADKLNTIHSDIPFISVSEEFSGVDPNQLKTATISQDLTLFPLRDGKLIKFTKESDSISVNEDALKESISEMNETEIEKIPVTLGYYARLFSQFEKVTTNITFKDDEEFNGYLIIHVRGEEGATTFFHFNREDFVNIDQPYKIFNDYLLSVRAELTPEQNLVLTFNQHEQIEKIELYFQWFTSMKKAPIEPRFQEKRISTRIEFPTEHFDGYKDPIETEGNVPQPIADEESH